MIYFWKQYKGREVNSVDEAISFLKEYIYSETSLEIELIYFSACPSENELFILNFSMTGFRDYDRQIIPILGEITKDEADESWISIYK